MVEVTQSHKSVYSLLLVQYRTPCTIPCTPCTTPIHRVLHLYFVYRYILVIYIYFITLCVKIQQSKVATRGDSFPSAWTEQLSAEVENSGTAIMADIINLVELRKLQHNKQMEKQDRQHAEQMAVLIALVKSSDVDMKHLIEPDCNGAKGSSTQVASFEPCDSSSMLWLDYQERFRTFLNANSIPKEKEAQLFPTNQTTVNYKLLIKLATQQPPLKRY